MTRGTGAAAALFLLACVAGAELLDRSTAGDLALYREYGEAILDGQVPYRDFFVEYPPGALVAFVVPALPPVDFELAFRLAMAGLGVAAIVLFGRIRSGVGAAAVLVAAPLALGSTLLTYYDLWPAVLTLAAVAALLLGRQRLGAATLGVAVAAKVYPLALVPLFALHLVRRHGRDELLRAAAAGAATFLVVVGPFLVLAPGGLRHAARFQADRPLHAESLGGSVLLAADELGLHSVATESSFNSENVSGALADAVAQVSTVLQVLAVAAVALLFARSRRLPDDLLAAAAAAVTAAAALGKVLSPQFLVWLVPLVPLVRQRRAAAAALLLGALLATRLLERWDGVADGSAVWMLLVRNALLVGLLGLLTVQLARRRA